MDIPAVSWNKLLVCSDAYDLKFSIVDEETFVKYSFSVVLHVLSQIPSFANVSLSYGMQIFLLNMLMDSCCDFLYFLAF